MRRDIVPETSVNLIILAAVIAGLFSTYQLFAPELTQIRVNKSAIENQSEILEDLKENQLTTNKHLLMISNSVSRIAGKLEKD